MEIPDIYKLVLPRLKAYFAATNDLLFISQFVDAAPATVESWIKEDNSTNGIRLIRLWHFLNAAGYAAPEMKKMSQFGRYLSELVGFSVIDLNEAKQLCGVVHSPDALNALRGRQPMNPTVSLEEMKEMYGENLEKAKAVLQEQLAGPPDEVLSDRAGAAVEVAPAFHQSRQGSTFDLPVGLAVSGDIYSSTLTLATLLSAAAPLARFINSDQCTPADRSRLRALMGDGGVFDLSNILNQLCSEDARKTMKGKK